MDCYAGLAADELVIGALVGVLKASPPTDTVDKDDIELGLTVLDVSDQMLKRHTAVEPQAALARIGVGADDLEAATGGLGRVDKGDSQIAA
jgi:hypothetical protein